MEMWKLSEFLVWINSTVSCMCCDIYYSLFQLRRKTTSHW